MCLVGFFFLGKTTTFKQIGYEGKKSTRISREMDNACEKLPSKSNKASVIILYVCVIVYLVTLLIASLFCFSNCQILFCLLEHLVADISSAVPLITMH